MNYNREKYVSWDDIQMLCRGLAHKIHAERPDLTKMLAITRGGLFPAGILARELGIRTIETIGIGSYDEQDRGLPQILKDAQSAYLEDVLVVDDLADTGNTLKMLKQKLIKPVVVTLFVKPEGAPFVDYYAEEVPQSTWVRFPWDTVRQYVPPVVAK
ncbi:MAG: xanthine phosphoribosyltransferase [Pseudobdellovibrionaceae bacterium]